MTDDIAIQVRSVGKTFKLPHEKQTSIKSLFISLFKGKRTYERQKVLNNISFEIKKGEFFGIVGRNGSGKSTLLKLLAGIYSPDKGQIQINGKLTPFIELGVGFNPELTGRENVFLNGALLGFNRNEMEAMYDDIVNFAELERFMDQKLKNYSSGMQVRLAFSIAIRAQASILLLDEVLAVGDIAFQKKCLNYFEKLKEENLTVVFVSHDMSSVERFCDRVLVMDQGSIDGIYVAPEGVRRYEDFNLKSEIKEYEFLEKAEINGEQLIKSCKITSSDNEKIIKLGESIKGSLLLDFKKHTQQESLADTFSCSVTFFNSDGVHVMSSETPANHYSRVDKKITFTIPNTVLSPGLYTAYFGLYHKTSKGESVCLYRTRDPIGFGIESGGKNITRGIFQSNAEWSTPAVKKTQ